jgi:hypothetical protein
MSISSEVLPVIDEGVGQTKCNVIYLLTAIWLTPDASSTLHINKKKYTEQHNETEYTEQNIHNNKNTQT